MRWSPQADAALDSGCTDLVFRPAKPVQHPYVNITIIRRFLYSCSHVLKQRWPATEGRF